jgi:hypothetical protein
MAQIMDRGLKVESIYRQPHGKILLKGVRGTGDLTGISFSLCWSVQAVWDENATKA